MNQSRVPHQIKLILNPHTTHHLQLSLLFERNSIDGQMWKSEMVGTDFPVSVAERYTVERNCHCFS
jgi:hypothetical protein